MAKHKKKRVREDGIEEEVEETQDEEEVVALKPPQPIEILRVGEPERDGDGALTHKGMRQVIARGGSVVHEGKHFSKIEELPDAIKLEGNSVEALDSMEEDLDRQEAELAAKRKRINKRRKKLDREVGEAEAETSEETEE
jgi:hypothetical protein